MLLEMDLETTIYVTGIVVVFLQCLYLDGAHKWLNRFKREKLCC